MAEPKFRLGRIVATPGAIEAMKEAGQIPEHFLSLHASGAWGDLDNKDRKANEAAIAHEGDIERKSRIVSSYRTRNNVKLWVITEADRLVTTLLLPEEY